MRHTHISTTGLKTHSSSDGNGKVDLDRDRGEAMAVLHHHQEELGRRKDAERGGEELDIVYVDGSGSGRLKIAHVDMQQGVVKGGDGGKEYPTRKQEGRDGNGEVKSASGNRVRRGIGNIVELVRRSVSKEQTNGKA